MDSTFFTFDETDPEHLAKVVCGVCGSYLEIHLPDPQWPDRLLGTCSECRAWYLIDREAGRMVLLDEDVSLPD